MSISRTCSCRENAFRTGSISLVKQAETEATWPAADSCASTSSTNRMPWHHSATNAINARQNRTNETCMHGVCLGGRVPNPGGQTTPTRIAHRTPAEDFGPALATTRPAPQTRPQPPPCLCVEKRRPPPTPAPVDPSPLTQESGGVINTA